MKKLIVFVSCCFLCITVYAGKKRCQPLLLKLQNVQAQQRIGHSGKKALSLQNRETKIRKKWWQCENAYYTEPAYKHHKKITRSHAPTISVEEVKKTIKPFYITNNVVIKSQFKGKKQQAWLVYYQMPQQCRQAKNIQIFVFCVENRHKQQQQFEHNYLK